jgi:predicted nucleic acid-binding protein
MSAYFSIVPYVQIGAKTWHSAQMLCWKLKDNGLTIPMGDALIAALALEHGCRLYADDAHFGQIAKHSPLRLYSPGYGGSYNAGER